MLPLPQGKMNPKAVRIMTEDGSSVIDIDKMTRNGRKLVMHGMLMGQFDTDVYITPADVFKLIPMMIKPGPLAFVLMSPFVCLWDLMKKTTKRKQDDE